MADRSSTPPRRFEFALDRADARAAVDRYGVRAVGLWPILILCFAGAALAAAAMPDRFADAGHLPAAAGAAALAFAIAHGWRALKVRRLAARRVVGTPVVVEDSGDHLTVTEDGAARRCAFADLTDAASDGARLFLAAGPRDVLVLPLRAFGDRAKMNAFWLSCRERVNAADAEVAAPAPAGAEPLPGLAPLLDALAVEIALEPGDVAAVQAACAPPRTLSLAQAALFASLIGGFGAAALAYGIASTARADMLWTIVAFCGWGGATLLTFVGARRMEAASRADWPADDPRRARRRLAIDGAGLTLRGADFETRLAWSSIAEIRETEDYILFITGWKDIHAAPRRCFPTEEAMSAFVAAAQAWKAGS